MLTFAKCILQMSTFHYSNLRVKFEGEEGSGPGVNRGFFAAMANALKTDEKVCMQDPDFALFLVGFWEV